MTRRFSIVVALFVSAWSSPAWADNTICANAEPLIVGSQASDTLPAAGSIFFKTALTAGRSYIFWVYPPYQDASEGTTGVSLALFTGTTCVTPATGTSVTEREPLGNISGADVDQISVKPSATGTYVIQISNTTANAYTVAATVVETSIFSPWWFVGGFNQAFVTLRNNMSQATTATLTLFASDGAVCGTEEIALASNANTYLRVNDYPACVPSPYHGSAAITYFGPPGGIAANTTVIDGTQGISFDEPFTQRMVWSVLVR
jgi:hypothetical protein